MVAAGAACGRPEGSGANDGGDGTGVTASPMHGSSLELATMLAQPPGFVGIPDDPLSGPFGRAEVGQVFVDHPDDAAEIVRNGFVAGYLRNWQQPPPTPAAGRTAPPDTTSVTTLVLTFDTAEHARAVLAHFRARNRADGHQFFAVPAELSGGYGVWRGADSLGISFFGVGWVNRAYLFNIMVESTDPAVSQGQVVRLALSQDTAVP